MRHTAKTIAAVSVAFASVLAGCSSHDSSSPTSSAPGTCAPAPSPAKDVVSGLSLPDRSTAAGKTYVATLQTNCGGITLQLDGAKAPQTVASFIQLAHKGYWRDSPCHRLVTEGIFVLQCGDPTGTGNGDPGYGFGIENAPADGDYPTGTLAMARTDDPNSNGGQFFIVYDDTQLPTDGGGYSIFGHVTGGMPIVQAIAKAGVQGGGTDGPPAKPISILKVSVTEK